ILAPLVNNQKGSHQVLLNKLKRDGFIKVLINDEIYFLENVDSINLDKNKRWNIDLFIDRVRLSNDDDIKSRISSAIEVALEQSNGLISTIVNETKKNTYS
nr:putative excinuclease ABC subunit A [Mycoplasma hominis] [Metamycoplasma hominis ATCC 23114]